MSIEEIQEASLEDSVPTEIRKYLTANQPHELPPYYKTVADELCFTGQVILLRGHRIILPAKP